MKLKLFFICVLILAIALGFKFLKPMPILNESPQTQNSIPSQTATSTPPDNQPTTVTTVPLTFTNKKTINLTIPQNYTMTVAAQGFRHARFMAMSPDTRLFFGDMTNASDTHTGKIYVLDGFNEQTGTFSSQKVYLSNLRNPNSLTFYTDSDNKTWIYIALTNELVRYPYTAGDNAPSGPGQTLATFPDTPHNPPQGYWHLTRTVKINDNKVYVSIGSSCDSCEETETLRGVILSMNPDGSDQKIIASGLRNAVGIIFKGNDLYATVNESDKLGADRPNDGMYKISTGTNYGWPYCYEFQNKIYANTTQTWSKNFDCSTVPLAWAELPPHSAPLGLAYFTSNFTDPALANSFLVALHGSGDATIGNGNTVDRVDSDGKVTELITGFYQNQKRLGRAVDILPRDNKSFFISDDFNGAIYFLKYN